MSAAKSLEAPDGAFELTLRAIAMPADANPAGDTFGGWVMSQMDLAAFARACELAKSRTVTAAVREMVFRAPVHTGDTVSLYTSVKRLGRSSATILVQVWAKPAHGAALRKVTEGEFVMVAVDASGAKTEAFARLAAAE